MQRDEVALGEQFVKFHQRNLVGARCLHIHVGIERDHFHAKGGGAPRDLCADAAQADHAERLAHQLLAHELAARPLAAPDRCIGLRDVARHRQHHRQRVFAGGDGVGLRRVHHDDAPAGGRIHVNRVHADTGSSDHAQPLAALDHFGIHLRLAAHDQRIVLADAGQKIGAGHLLRHVHRYLRVGFEQVKPCG